MGLGPSLRTVGSIVFLIIRGKIVSDSPKVGTLAVRKNIAALQEPRFAERRCQRAGLIAVNHQRLTAELGSLDGQRLPQAVESRDRYATVGRTVPPSADP